MKGQFFRISWNSIRLKLVLSMLFITIPMIAFLIYNNLYAITVVRHQVAESNRNLISLYMDQIDDNLNDLDAYMTNLIVNDKDLQMMSYMNRDQRVLAKVRLDAKMTADIGTLKTVDSIFVYSIADQDYFDVFRGFGNNTQERSNVRAYIRSLIRELEERRNSISAAGTSNGSVKRTTFSVSCRRVMPMSARESISKGFRFRSTCWR